MDLPGRQDLRGTRRPASPSPLPRRTFLGALGAAAVLGTTALPASAATYPLLTRAQWGADEALRHTATGTERWPPAYYPVQTLTVHHTADGGDSLEAAARVRAIYRADAAEYGDLGYHYLIDAAGQVYEGRWSGTDGTPAHDAAGRLVTAAHIGEYNSGNVGIALLGTFTAQSATPEARVSLARLLAELAGRHGVDPLADVVYRNPVSNVVRTVPAIGGHRDWASTECPGALYTDLPYIRREVAELLAG
ncbi:peptidoglycan recognition protein family protein [Streptomyces europaeiscabiei]|uniref:peptidoglycan recognition protein family protein n=1 Tax=Streptomyces europaeiscabiei TaxID=146819 RepID=UPI0029BF269D|nr:peptidoglycan recognition family protein [Streptomyces europaeiscabiei]MDX3589365.1 peptidoglycan recognition family protein [Streptomyces europaeiscabiei]